MTTTNVTEYTMDIEQLRTITQFAALAPSVHNTQPWRFDADGHTIEVRADIERMLQVLDPTARQLHISCGVAVEFARLAVRALGYDCVVRLQPKPDGDPTLLATLTVGHPLPATESERRMIDAIPRRYTDRGPYDAGPLPAPLLGSLRDAAAERGCWLRVLDRPGDRTTAAMLLAEAEEIERSDAGYRAELAAWRRTGTAPDGIPVEAAQHWHDDVVSDVPLRDFLGDPPEFLPGDDEVPPSVERDTLVLIGSDDDTIIGWLRTGRALALVMLQLTQAGATSQPLGPVVDVPATRARLQRGLGLLGHPQLLLRIGYGHGAPTTGRRDVDDLLNLHTNGTPS
ncbi:MAG TPA: hypothetical protein VFJ17_00805 [Mycobacteriales bacterium]|jgi:hypothetical protein|nr:hypothetical protein [Mycobacteriales bacterium]